MSSKSIIVTSSLAAGSTDNPEHPSAVPNGEVWVISHFGAADINLGDNKSTVYALRFGTDILRVISVTGVTYDIPMKVEITGNGTKKLNVLRVNNSGSTKQCPFWIDAHKRN